MKYVLFLLTFSLSAAQQQIPVPEEIAPDIYHITLGKLYNDKVIFGPLTGKHIYRAITLVCMLMAFYINLFPDKRYEVISHRLMIISFVLALWGWYWAEIELYQKTAAINKFLRDNGIISFGLGNLRVSVSPAHSNVDEFPFRPRVA